MSNRLSIETVTTLERLEALAVPWEAIWRRCPAATPFQSPHWLLPWWRVFGGAELCVFTASKGGGLCAFAPIFCYTDPDNRRRLVFIGSSITDLQNVLIDPGLERLVMEHFYQWLGSEAPAWDECLLEQLPADSPLLECGMRNAECGMREKENWACSWRPQEPCLVLSLPDADDLSSVVPGAMRKNVRYYERRARESGELCFECATPSNFEELFEALLCLHGARWDEFGQAGVLSGEAIARFHRQAAAAMLAAGMLRFHALRLDGRIIACHYGFHHGGSSYYYLGGFDPGMKELSPGTLVVAHALAEAVREGAREFNFLRGREAYKYRWGALDRPCYQLQLKKAASDHTIKNQRRTPFLKAPL